MTSRSQVLSNIDLQRLENFILSYPSQVYNEEYTIATSFTTHNFWKDMWKIWLAAILSNWSQPPRILLLYSGERPNLVLPSFCTMLPSIWTLSVPHKGVATFNFCQKIQALLMSKSEFNIWCDCDNLVLAPLSHIFNSSSFVQKTRRVAGGLYCISKKDKEQFYSILLEKISSRAVSLPLNSDQKLLYYSAKQLNNALFIRKEHLDKEYWVSLSSRNVKSKIIVDKYLTSISRIVK